MSTDLPRSHWDIFCKVVDNFGDIGVCWRLAQQLAEEHGRHICLWVDDLALAERFVCAGHARITLKHWTENADFRQVADVVIETFGCGLPEAYQQQMPQQSSIWVNVDYLSAENWVEGFHAQPSPQANGLVRHFFYPGFTPLTGGLLREASLTTLQTHASWEDLGLVPAAGKLSLSLFCYAHAPLAGLVNSLQHSTQAVRVMVPEPVAPMLANVLGVTRLEVGQHIQRQQAEFVVIPFLSQAEYDRLLYLCDFNFVRGEDSWIRAIWAGKPMIWLPYQQSEETHLVKLKAFMQHYLAQAETPLSAVIQHAMQAWAQGSWQATDWESLLSVLPQFRQHAQAFKLHQSQQVDLATNLVIFIEKYRTHRV
ncbi:elongation factor P maturation arginine rhamnosyltransferase EarP [Methylophilus sp. TWE2]|uniref:elongation factor P maturation arginine rhamnosyltransferase EarP n=1 Tax=Methylophilus sp. TWE2 TaxID=1662285 RepID=UPI0006713986|nr:elongation factor P maturation arginine rhamnosyltransferase EarP [Methylophilus sp. TWE2]AKR43651.1 hypothetical protein ACJ67_09590 [Methylophilus sp. TWE2]